MNDPVFKLEQISQVCIVVRDLEKTMDAYWRLLGVGPWRVYTFGPETAKEITYRGKPGNFHMRMAHASVGGLAIELIQPLDGDTIHKEFLDSHGEGVQHLGIRLKNLDDAVEKLGVAGFQVVQGATGTGQSADGAHVYLDTDKELGVVLELSLPPSAWRSGSWYPEPPPTEVK